MIPWHFRLPRRGIVHLHVLNVIKECSNLTARATGVLSQAEWARARRFHFEQDRHIFVARRVWLRTMLAGYLTLDPASVPLIAGEHGKPALANTIDLADLRFNTSHSRTCAVIAVAQEDEVGVDVEGEVPDELDGVARVVMTHKEIAAFSQIVGISDRQRAFLTLWTRKEALLKAIGTGMLLAPKTVEAGLMHGTPPVPGPRGYPGCWSLVAFAPGPGLAGAVALAGERLTIVACDPSADIPAAPV